MSHARVTIRDVAAHAGVSHQTVSRVINDSERVSPATRARVKAAISDLDYRPSAIARSMARGRTGILACISPNLTDYTFAAIIDGAERALSEEGFFLLSASAPDADTFRVLIEQLVDSRRAEGLLIINPYADERFRYLPDSVPMVFAGARPRAEAANSVALDDVAVGLEATMHLLGLGHRRIGTISGPLAEDCSQDRLAGYEQALADAGQALDPALVIEGNWQARSGYAAFQQYAAAGTLPDAVFAQNDQMAAGVLRAAGDLGIDVPGQLAVIGVDDIPMAPYFNPPLTTLRQDFARIGREAAQLLLGVLAQPAMPRQQLRLPAELIVRRSTGARVQ